ncbi:hypothetical protein GCM10011374_39880 [Kocuria dechangensis]|uniref:TadE-like domain-containing protein n=1 Tax=Kocuria dechangensis TaxID=1176249 RepID=A0A917H8S6_9MICC|nr:TadE family protein [Kocuria dechangensis]GGG71229.1 hypothetical protein GCM10011374_39880 [Kocuria dechangensis]
MNPWRSERGAAAVEFALILPFLLLIIMGVIEFGRGYNAQISLTHAARETARTMAVSNNWSTAVNTGRLAAPTLNLDVTDFKAAPSAPPASPACVAGSMITVTIEYELDTITGFFDDIDLEGKAAMRCGG